MALKVGIVSQKGGVGKSTFTRALASEYSKNEWSVLIADMDSKQGTSFEWNSRRLQKEELPFIAVQQFSNINQVNKIADNYDIIFFDGAPHSSKETLEISANCDLVILPTNTSLDDLTPQVRLAHELKNKGLQKEKILFLLSRVTASKVEIDETIEYINTAGYKVLKNHVQEKTAYRQAMDLGLSITETKYKTLNQKADDIVQEVANSLQ